MRLRFSVQNVGLDRVEGSEVWTTQISLRGAKREALDGAAVPLPDPLPVDPDELAAAIAAAAAAAPNLIDTFNVTIELGDFTVQELMEGRSDAKPDGDILDFDLDLALPSGARLNDIIDPDFAIVDYLWVIEIKLDSTDVVRESQIVREDPALVAPTGLPWWIFNPFEANGSDFFAPNTDQNEGLFGISFQPSTVSQADWEAQYPGYPADAAGMPDEVANFLAYAFNRNPADGDTTGNRFPGTYGVSDFEGDEYLSIAFDIVTRADDLIYTVQADDNVGFTSPEPIVVIDGPYNTLTGATSLTGDGGLLLSEGNVTSVLDQGYSARVTVKDSQDVTVDPMRFIRVLVDSVPVNPVPDP